MAGSVNQMPLIYEFMNVPPINRICVRVSVWCAAMIELGYSLLVFSLSLLLQCSNMRLYRLLYENI